MQRGLDAYRRTQVQSRTPVELVVMLYDGAMRHLAAAQAAVTQNDIRARRDAVNSVLAIISELQSTLDVERGGQIADSLDDLYSYMTRRMMDGARANTAAPFAEVERLIGTLREGWQAIASIPPATARATEHGTTAGAP